MHLQNRVKMTLAHMSDERKSSMKTGKLNQITNSKTFAIFFILGYIAFIVSIPLIGDALTPASGRCEVKFMSSDMNYTTEGITNGVAIVVSDKFKAWPLKRELCNVIYLDAGKIGDYSSVGLRFTIKTGKSDFKIIRIPNIDADALTLAANQ